MTLAELIDVSENTLIISEYGYENPFLTISNLDCNCTDDFSDVLTKEFLDRNIEFLRAGDGYIKVNLGGIQ